MMKTVLSLLLAFSMNGALANELAVEITNENTFPSLFEIEKAQAENKDTRNKLIEAGLRNIYGGAVKRIQRALLNSEEFPVLVKGLPAFPSKYRKLIVDKLEAQHLDATWLADYHGINTYILIKDNDEDIGRVNDVVLRIAPHVSRVGLSN